MSSIVMHRFSVFVVRKCDSPAVPSSILSIVFSCCFNRMDNERHNTVELRVILSNCNLFAGGLASLSTQDSGDRACREGSIHLRFYLSLKPSFVNQN